MASNHCRFNGTIWLILALITLFGYDDKFDWFFNMFNIISYTLTLPISAFLIDVLIMRKETGKYELRYMSLLFVILAIVLIVGYIVFQNNKLSAFGKHEDPYWDFMPVFVGYYPYVIMLVVSAVLLVVLFFTLVRYCWDLRK